MIDAAGHSASGNLDEIPLGYKNIYSDYFGKVAYGRLGEPLPYIPDDFPDITYPFYGTDSDDLFSIIKNNSDTVSDDEKIYENEEDPDDSDGYEIDTDMETAIKDEPSDKSEDVSDDASDNTKNDETEIEFSGD